MDVYFSSEDLAATCNSEQACGRRWGAQQAKVVMRRLKQLQQANTLYEMSKISAAHLHHLVGNYAGYLAVNTKDGLRIVFEPANDPLPVKPDGGLDWHRVTMVRIHSIENYHHG